MSTRPTPAPALPPTPGQTVGPFFHDALPFPRDAELVPPGRADAVRLHGRVLDGAGAPVPDALVEVRQADPDGGVPAVPGSLHRDGATFTGWGRCATDRAGGYTFSTLRPGPVDGGLPFFSICVFARGLLDRLLTRAYLPADDVVLAADPLLAALDPERRATLLAVTDDLPGVPGFRFDVVLQGAGETVFLQHAGAAGGRR